MDYNELANKVKAKYPGAYDDMDNMTLAKSVIQKHPEYSDVTFSDQHQDNISDIPGNAVKDVSGILETLRRGGQGILDLPKDTYETGKQIFQGQPVSETPIGQDVKTLGNVALQSLPHGVTDPNASNLPVVGQYRVEPGSIFRQYQDLAAQPLKSIPGKIGETMKQAYPGNPITEHPVNSALALAPLAKPILSSVREIPGVDEGLNKASDYIRQNIVAPNARRTLGKFPMKMPIDEANQVGLDAMDQGVIKNPITNPIQSTPKSMLNRVTDLNESIGENIGNFLRGQGEGLNATKAAQELDQVKGQFMNDPEIVAKVDRAKEMILRNSNNPVQDTIVPERIPQTMDFAKGNKIKTLFQKKVNYFSDAANQEGGKAIASNLRNSIDSQLDDLTTKLGNKGDMQSFLADKNLYGSTSKMQDALTNQVNRDARNMPVSLPTTVVTAAAGGLKGLIYEWTKRYGSATAASMANDVAKALQSSPEFELTKGAVSKAAIPAISESEKKSITKDKAKEFLDKAGGDKARARQIARKAGYSW